MGSLDETAAAVLEVVALRQNASNRVHFALVMPDAIVPATSFGAACTVVAGPIRTTCGATLRRVAFVIPDEHLAGWRQGRNVCRECELTLRLALARAEADQGAT